MHHRRQKTVSSSNSSTKGHRESGYESMQRLRYLNKKPLCLQYNMLGSYSRRNSTYRSKRKEEALIIAIIFGLVKLLIWLAALIKKEIWDFLTKPADQLFPIKQYRAREHPEYGTSPHQIRKRNRKIIRRYYSIRNQSTESNIQPYVRDLSGRGTMHLITTCGGQASICSKPPVSL